MRDFRKTQGALLIVALLAPTVSLADDSTSVTGAVRMAASACPNLPGYNSTTVPPGMRVDSVGNCVPSNITAPPTEVTPPDFNIVPVCASETTSEEYWPYSGWTMPPSYYNPSFRSYTRLVDRSFSGAATPGAACASLSNPAITSRPNSYNFSFTDPQTGLNLFVTKRENLNRVKMLMAVPASKALKIGCAAQTTSGSAPGAKLVYPSGTSVMVVDASSGWNIAYSGYTIVSEKTSDVSYGFGASSDLIPTGTVEPLVNSSGYPFSPGVCRHPFGIYGLVTYDKVIASSMQPSDVPNISIYFAFKQRLPVEHHILLK